MILITATVGVTGTGTAAAQPSVTPAAAPKTTTHYSSRAHADVGFATGWRMPYGAVALRVGAGVNRIHADVGIGFGAGVGRGGPRYGATVRVQPTRQAPWLWLGVGLSKGPYKDKASLLWGDEHGWEQVLRLNLEAVVARFTAPIGRVDFTIGAGVPLNHEGCYSVRDGLLTNRTESPCDDSPDVIPYLGIVFRAEP